MYDIGTVLAIKYFGFTHYGIYTEDGRVIHNSKKYKKVVEISLEEFQDGRAVSVSPNIKAPLPESAVETAKRYIGLPYSLFGENCEHFVRMICGMVKESTQVQKYLIITASTGVIWKVRDPVAKAAAVGGAVGVFITPEEQSPFIKSLAGATLAGASTWETENKIAKGALIGGAAAELLLPDNTNLLTKPVLGALVGAVAGALVSDR